jgi:hypothetical protein
MLKPTLKLLVKDDSGRSVDFVPLGVRPLTFSDLLNSKKSGADTYELELFANNPVIDGTLHPGPITFKALATFNEPVGVYALVDGGWVPPPFAIPPNLLVDRNVVSALKQIRLGSQRADFSPFNYWLQFFKGGALFNPLLYAIEGRSRTTPSFEQFVNAFEEGSAEIASAFPGSKVKSFGKSQYNTVYKALVKDNENQLAQEIEFILKIVPLVINRVPKKRLETIESAILDAASIHGLYHSSLIVIAVISCLYEDHQGLQYPVGRRILKPCQHYSQAHAYNAIADLKNLELFINCRGTLKSVVLCTCDMALALFWCGLSPIDGHVLDGVLNYSAFLDKCLFPRATEADLERLRALMQ